MSLQVGVDLVSVSRIAESLGAFGERFLRRIFTPGEVAYATAAPALTHERLAARFAAKEAALKAFDLVEVGVSWRDLEVTTSPSGAPELRLHGRARELVSRQARAVSVSLSHEGDIAVAVVVTTASTITMATGESL